MKKATAEVWGFPCNSQLYRQLAIGVTEEHVKEVYTPFNRYDDKSPNASANVVFAWQTGHRPLQRESTYGRNVAFPTKLQPGLLQAYEEVSTRWHEFLHQTSKALPLTKKTQTLQRFQSSQSLYAHNTNSRQSPKTLPTTYLSTQKRTLPWRQDTFDTIETSNANKSASKRKSFEA
ncbi:hypothetical protein F5884DRAFT_811481 [Xylogone sp. PMI_703]|nr:hypothetical protein F5884DRAFT_811481 [Xylogone sp. PMI_703]